MLISGQLYGLAAHLTVEYLDLTYIVNLIYLNVVRRHTVRAGEAHGTG